VGENFYTKISNEVDIFSRIDNVDMDYFFLLTQCINLYHMIMLLLSQWI